MWRLLVFIFLGHFSLHYSIEIKVESRVCVDGKLLTRYQLNNNIYKGCKLFEKNQHEFHIRLPRKVDPTFRGKPIPHNEALAAKFGLFSKNNLEQTNSLIKLVHKIASEYLSKCPPIIYYDSYVQNSDKLILEMLFKSFPITYYHGEINEKYELVNKHFLNPVDTICRSYILFLSDPMMTRKLIGPQIESRVVLISRSSQWKLKDFLSSEVSSNIVNLLVIGESLTITSQRERPYVLYTHELYSDGLGSNTPIVLTSWIKNTLTRPHVNLFPPKFNAGFSGHSFPVSASNQPPFTFRLSKLAMGGTISVSWDGIEYRLLNLIGEKLNFTIEVTTAPLKTEGRNVVKAIKQNIFEKSADIGMSGVYITAERLEEFDMSVGHSRDCAAFITLASKALPKYRAILGPFQWPVWVALIFVYLGAVFPIVYSDRLTLKHLMGNWGEIENMFWYVFGMFTNSFTFSGQFSWTKTEKISTRLLIGSYWVFTIIITSCYTGSIIAFVTLPAFPETVDSVQDLLGLFFRVATLDNDGWESWFQNSTHVPTAKLYKKMEFVSSFKEGIGNVTQSFFWNYAFLASRAQLEYLVQNNVTDENISKRSALHLSDECFALFQIGYIFPKHSVYKEKINSMILLAQQSGILEKIQNEVSWTMQRSSSGKLLQTSYHSLRPRAQEERQLTTADTEGMFLLMAIGYGAGVIALISEVVGGITNKCHSILRRARRRSTNGNLTNDGLPHIVEEEEEEENGKRKQQRSDSNEWQQVNNYGFSLTKNALKDLFSSYHRHEPNYILRDGRLILEDTEISVTSDVTDPPSTSLPSLRIRKNTIVLAKVDVHNETDVLEEHVTGSLALLDKYLAEQEQYQLDTNLMELNDDDTCIGYLNENALFGSYVDSEDKTVSRLDELNLSLDEQQ